MITCTFIGRGHKLDPRIMPVLQKELEQLIRSGDDFTFCSRSYSEFEKACEQIIFDIKARYRHRKQPADKAIDLLSINPIREHYSDDSEPYTREEREKMETGIFPLSKEEKALRWTIDQSDVVITYVLDPYDDDYDALMYAKSKEGLRIIRIDPPPSL